MKELDGFRAAAQSQENWEAALVYDMAEDLTDNILKQLLPGSPTRLISAFEANRRSASAAEEEAWDNSILAAQIIFEENGLAY